MYWTLQLAAAAATTFEAAGLRLLGVTRVNLAPSVLRMVAVVGDGKTATPIALQTLVTIRRRTVAGATAVIWFKGWVSKATPVISGRSHRIDYEVSNALYWFERVPYLQTWYTLVDPTNLAASVVGGYRTRILLGRGANNTLLTIREVMQNVIAQVVTMASTSGLADVPIQEAASDYPALYVPTRELQSITHGATIRELLKYVPDAVVTVDDTTNPPTLRLTRRSAATTRTIAMSEARAGAIGLVRQTEMEFSRVAVIYARTDTVNGGQVGYTTADVYPVPGGFSANDPTTYGSFLLDFGCLVHYVDLQGWGISTVTSTLVTRVWDATSHSWWKNHHAQLDDAITGPDGTGSPVFTPVRLVYEDGSQCVYDPASGVAPTLANELLNTGGAVHGGFYLPNSNTPVVAFRYRLEGKVAYADAGGASHSRPIFAEFTATNASSGTFTKSTVFQVGESPPAGLAQEMHTALSAARWVGTIPLSAQDIDVVVNLGDLINLTGGRTEWATMAAQVQQIDENPHSGERTLTVGPVGFLSAADRIELMRGLRNLGPGAGSTPPSLQASGGPAAVIVPTPARVPSMNTTHSDVGGLSRIVSREDEKVTGTFDGNGRLRLVATDDTATPLVVKDTAEIDLNLEDAEGSDGLAKVIKLREISICDDDGVTGKILVPCSPIFYP